MFVRDTLNCPTSLRIDLIQLGPMEFLPKELKKHIYITQTYTFINIYNESNNSNRLKCSKTFSKLVNHIGSNFGGNGFKNQHL